MSEAPERTALYRIWGDEDLLLYIGISKDFGDRWKKHAKTQPWWDEMRRLTADEWFESRPEAENAEAAAIRVERPRYNVTHNPAARTPVVACNPLNEWFGAQIRELREARYMSQEVLAAEMADRGLGWHQQTVTRIETGQQRVRWDEAVALAVIFDLSVNAFTPPPEIEAYMKRKLAEPEPQHGTAA